MSENNHKLNAFEKLLGQVFEVASGAVKSGEYIGNEKKVFAISLDEPENSQSLAHRLLDDKDGLHRFFSSSDPDFEKKIQDASASNKTVKVIASPFTDELGTHNIIKLDIM